MAQLGFKSTQSGFRAWYKGENGSITYQVTDGTRLFYEMCRMLLTNLSDFPSGGGLN